VFQCPSCAIQLRFQDDELHIHEGENNDEGDLEDIDIVSEEISKLKRKISSLESSIPIKQNKLERHKEVSKSIDTIESQYEELPNLPEMKTELDYIHKYRLSQENLVKQLDKLQTNTNHSSTISSFEKSLHKLEKKIQELKNNSTKEQIININEEDIRNNIITQKQNKEKINTMKHTMKKLSSEKITYETQLEKCKQKHIEKYKILKTKHELDSKIKTQLSELSNIETKLNEHQKNVEDIEKYEKYQKLKEAYNIWENKITVLHKEELECRKQYASTTLLREKILEAESIAMLNIITSINTHSQVYLDAFFPDHPISVRLVPFKESKKGKTITKKPQINLEIEYKGMEADINMLSGGETSRVVLAYALALGEMFNTPMMLLDECTASLDQELTGDVIDGIREHFTGKLVLLICHQVVSGQFDKVIKI
jgi:DNA repair exonuclease SbcCD ATPase subunit